jgi:hypothetical protein
MSTLLFQGNEVTVSQPGPSLSRVIDNEGREFWVKTVDLKVKKLTRAEQYRASVETIRRNPLSYRLAGWIVAHHDSNLHVSTPPAQQDATIDELLQHGVDFDEETLTISADVTHGRSYSVVTEAFRFANELRLTTQVHSTQYHDTNRVSIQAKQFVLDFLLGDLRFKLGNKRQDVEAILARVPVEFQTAFLYGMEESI